MKWERKKRKIFKNQIKKFDCNMKIFLEIHTHTFEEERD